MGWVRSLFNQENWIQENVSERRLTVMVAVMGKSIIIQLNRTIDAQICHFRSVLKVS